MNSCRGREQSAAASGRLHEHLADLLPSDVGWRKEPDNTSFSGLLRRRGSLPCGSPSEKQPRAVARLRERGCSSCATGSKRAARGELAAWGAAARVGTSREAACRLVWAPAFFLGRRVQLNCVRLRCGNGWGAPTWRIGWAERQKEKTPQEKTTAKAATGLRRPCHVFVKF